jgi:hypothetical protein
MHCAESIFKGEESLGRVQTLGEIGFCPSEKEYSNSAKLVAGSNSGR